MKKIHFKNKQVNFFAKIFYSFVVCIAITIFVLSSILYINFEKISLTQTNTYIKDNLNKVSSSTNFMMDSAKLLLVQLLYDRDILALLHSSSLEENEINTYRRRLSSYRNATPFLHSIYIYNSLQNRIYTDQSNKSYFSMEDFSDKNIFNLIEDTRKIYHLLPYPRIIKSDNTLSFNVYYNVYTFILYETPYNHSSQDNSIILNISEDQLRSNIKTLDSNKQGDTFIINGKGNLVISNNNKKMLSDISRQKYIQQILSSKTPNNYFVANIDGVKSLITYVSSDNPLLDWKYVSVIPYYYITKQIDNMKRNTIFIGLLILIFGFLITYFTSKNIYKPINNMQETLKNLKTEKQQSQYPLKHEFLRNIIISSSQQKIEPIITKFKDYNLHIDPNGEYCVIVFKIDHFTDFCNKYNNNDRGLLRFAIINIVDELSSAFFKCDCVDMGNDHIVMLANIPHDFYALNDTATTNLLENIQAAVKNYLELSLTIIVNLQANKYLEDIEVLYNQALEASNYRLFNGFGSVIFFGKKMVLKASEYAYPTQKEKLLINSLMHKKSEEIHSVYEDIVKSTENYSYTVLSGTILRLTNAINSATDSIEKNTGISIIYSFDEFINKLNKLETIDEINKAFYSMFDNLLAALDIKKNTSHDNIINGIIESIHLKYMDQNLSVDTLTTPLDMSSVYIGRLFKKDTSKSVAEYISEVRVTKAKELLSTTNKPISDITTEVGFSSSNYFYTIFRKYNGITPAEYRQISQGK